MATDGRDQNKGPSELLLTLWERLVEGLRRIQVEAIKAIRIGRLRVEMLLMRRDRRAALLRLGEAAHAAVREGRVADPTLVGLAREVDDVDVVIDTKRDEAARTATLSDEEVLGRPVGSRPAEKKAGGGTIGSIPVTPRRDSTDAEDSTDGSGETGSRRVGGSMGAVPPSDL